VLLAKMLHILAAVIWVGGMFFAYMALRPAAANLLEPPQRLSLWDGVFTKFFVWVWISIAAILLTGYYMLMAHFGGFAGSGTYIHIMHGLGLVMVMLFMHVYFAPYKRLKRLVAESNFPEAGKNLNSIRKLVAINLTIGIITVVIAVAAKQI